MKKTMIVGALALGLTAGGAALTPSQNLFAHGKDFRAGMEARQEKRLDRMSQELSLTADQKSKIKALFDDQRAKMKAIHEDTHAKVLALLSPDQKEKLAKLREEKGKKD